MFDLLLKAQAGLTRTWHSVRSQHHLDFVTHRFPEYEGKVTGVIIPDIAAPGAYDDAVKDVDGIVHVASPVTLNWNDPSDVINPAVDGAVGILTSAAKFGKNVKRVILTSSSSSITSDDGPERTLWNEVRPLTYEALCAILFNHSTKPISQTYWNEHSAKLIEEHGKDSTPWAVYDASKTLAERAAWAFVEREKPTFDLTAILPTFNIGPYIHEVISLHGTTSYMLS